MSRRIYQLDTLFQTGKPAKADREQLTAKNAEIAEKKNILTTDGTDGDGVLSANFAKGRKFGSHTCSASTGADDFGDAVGAVGEGLAGGAIIGQRGLPDGLGHLQERRLQMRSSLARISWFLVFQ